MLRTTENPYTTIERNHEHVDTNTQSNAQEVEYGIEKLADHGLTQQGLMYRLMWYGYGTADDARELIANLSRNTVTRYCRKTQSGTQYIWNRKGQTGRPRINSRK